MKKRFFVGILVAGILVAALGIGSASADGIFAGNVELQRKEFNKKWMFNPEGFAVVRNAKFVWNFATLPPPPFAFIIPLEYNLKGNFYSPVDGYVKVTYENGYTTLKLKAGHYLLTFTEGNEYVALYGFEIK